MPASTLPPTNKLNRTNAPSESSSAAVNTAFPAATIPSSKSRTSAFPPMPKSAPKPLSSALGQPPTASQVAKSNIDVDYKTALKNFFEKSNPSKLPDVDSLLRKYEGKECEMFVSLAKKYKTKNGLDSEFLSRVKGIDANDIQALTRLYLEVYNKAKAKTEGYESKLLSKYKGREKDMFATMAQQWYTVNPLDLPKEEVAKEKNKVEARPKDPFAPKPRAETSAPSLSAVSEKPESKDEPSSSTSAFGSSHANPPDFPGTSPFTSSQSKPPASSSTASPFAASQNKEASVSTSSSPFAATKAPGSVAPSTSPFAPKQSASTATSPFASSFGSNNASPGQPDYNKMLTEFYQKHNPAKVSEVGKALEKYKGKEAEMFKKLAQKYNAPNPMQGDQLSAGGTTSTSSSFGFGNMAASMGSTTTPFSTSSAQTKSMGQFASAPSPFGGNAGHTKSPFSSTQSATPFGAPSATASSASPFTSTSSTTSAFGGTAPGGAFGSQSATSAPSPFGGQTPAPSPFGQTPASSPFGGQSSTFGQPQAGGAQQFGGRNPRDMLTQFYQRYNPNKVNEIDTLLGKYAGQLEQLFLKLAKKYNLDPAATFGVTPKQTTPSAPSFGSPSVLGGGTTPFGGGPAPSSGFGSFSANSSGGGFAAFASGGGNGFGGIAGGQPSVPAFGSNPTPFGAARR